MSEQLQKRIKKQREYDSSKNISFDFKLVFVYHISMIVLFATSPIDNAKDQATFALFLGLLLVAVSIAHKLKTRWSWPGLSVTSIPFAIFNLVFVYAFLAFAAYMITSDNPPEALQSLDFTKLISESWSAILKAASIPRFTPWFLAGIGIAVFNVLKSLKLAR